MTKDKYEIIKEHKIKHAILAFLAMTFPIMILVASTIVSVNIQKNIFANTEINGLLEFFMDIGPGILLLYLFRKRYKPLNEYLIEYYNYMFIKSNAYPNVSFADSESFHKNLTNRLTNLGYKAINDIGKTVYSSPKNNLSNIMLTDYEHFDKSDYDKLEALIDDNFMDYQPIQVVILTKSSSKEIKDFLTFEVNTYGTKKVFILYSIDTLKYYYKNIVAFEQGNRKNLVNLNHKAIFGYNYKELRKQSKEERS